MKRLAHFNNEFLVVATGILLTLPFAYHGISSGHDGITHVIRQRALDLQLDRGDFYLRWLSDMNSGLGSPSFFVVGPLPYLVGYLFRPIVATVIGGVSEIHELGLSMVLAMVVSGLGAYIWLKELVVERYALLGAILYMAAPYHAVVDFYARAAVSECWAMALAPFILYFARKVTDGEVTAISGLALSYALLAASHLFTLLLLTPIPVLYAFCIGRRGERFRAAIRVLFALTLGAGLSAIAWLPALAEQKNILASSSNGNRETHLYQLNFFFVHQVLPWLAKADEERFRANVYLLTILCVGTALGAFALAYIKSRLNDAERNFWLGATIASFLMMSSLSGPVWRILRPLQAIQFPWRFNTVLGLSMIALLTFVAADLKSPFSLSQKLLTTLLCLSILAWPVLIARSFVRSVPLQREPTTAEQLEISFDYLLPLWGRSVSENLRSAEGVRKIALEMNDRTEHAGNGDVEVEKWSSGNIHLLVNLPQPDRVTVRQFYYPRWTAEINGPESTTPLKVEASFPAGLISIRVPAGHHKLHLYLRRSFSENIAVVITGLSVLAHLWFVKRRRPSFTKVVQEPTFV